MTTENEEQIFWDPDNSIFPLMDAGEERATRMAYSPHPDPQVKSLRITMEFDERGDLKSYWEGSLDNEGNVLKGSCLFPF
jgi:hypothetical protein